MDIHAELKKAICKVNPGINEENITPEATFIGDLEMDSLSMVELSLAWKNFLELPIRMKSLQS
jgi:acyl carrier protein